MATGIRVVTRPTRGLSSRCSGHQVAGRVSAGSSPGSPPAPRATSGDPPAATARRPRPPGRWPAPEARTDQWDQDARSRLPRSRHQAGLAVPQPGPQQRQECGRRCGVQPVRAGVADQHRPTGLRSAFPGSTGRSTDRPVATNAITHRARVGILVVGARHGGRLVDRQVGDRRPAPAAQCQAVWPGTVRTGRCAAPATARWRRPPAAAPPAPRMATVANCEAPVNMNSDRSLGLPQVEAVGDRQGPERDPVGAGGGADRQRIDSDLPAGAGSGGHKGSPYAVQPRAPRTLTIASRARRGR